MASTKKNTTKERSKKEDTPDKEKISRRTQIRLGLGIAFLLIGIFICFSIFSYFFTWRVDQDKLLTGEKWYQFAFNANSTPANWGGRLGAALSHLMVYEWVGIAALTIGMWIGMGGLALLYGKKQYQLYVISDGLPF